jgi:aminoglycoside phosphotransferase (APT) family kinase protein
MNEPAAPGRQETIDPARVAAWLAATVDETITTVAVTRLAGGRSSGAWRLDAVTGDGERPMVLKTPMGPDLVYQRDLGREGRIVDALHKAGARVPRVLAVDREGRTTGRPCFVMELVDGRSVDDEGPAGHHGDPWYRGLEGEGQRAIWESFYDALASVHRVEPTRVPDALLGTHGVVDVIEHWRRALLDKAPVEWVPRHLAAIEWLREHLPPTANDGPAVCMGDARLVNSLITGEAVAALVDFEIAYIGNPAADVGYGLFVDSLQRRNVEQPVAALPSDEDTWNQWGLATGRSIDDRLYWSAFGAMSFCVTATRAMIEWGFGDAGVESANPIVPEWEAAIARAAE